MSEKPKVNVTEFEFNSNLLNETKQVDYIGKNWPVVYILSNESQKLAYVGETTDAVQRMSAHLKNQEKKKLKNVHFIDSPQFNKSATLDIESKLIKYLAADGQFNLLNGNLGITDHQYYQRGEVYDGIFSDLWNQLISNGITKHSLEHLNNSDLFKYSPYKSLSAEQTEGLIAIIDSLLSDQNDVTVVQGGAGTGKSILAIFFFKLLLSDNLDLNFKEFGEEHEEVIHKVLRLKKKYPNPKVGLVIPMSSFRKTLQKVFRGINGLNSKLVIGPADVAKDNFDILMVDESHRLRQRKNLGPYFKKFDEAAEKLGLNNESCSEVDWVVLQSKKSIFFYDSDQSIKPSDASQDVFDKLKNDSKTRLTYLKSQFRVKGGNAYIKFIDELLNCQITNDKHYESAKYDLKIVEKIEDLVGLIHSKNDEVGLSRLIAGYAWEWKSKKNPDQYDIELESTRLKWNSTNIDWINTKNSINEVGCIHTTQGYDLNYTGIIIGPELGYDPDTNQIVVYKEKYFDKFGKQSLSKPSDLKQYLLNIYKTILLRGIHGTYLYICDENLKSYFERFIPKMNQPKQTITPIRFEQIRPELEVVPFYDLKAAAGQFSDYQNPSEIKWLEFSKGTINNIEDKFACIVLGESMNKIIPNNSICLFSKYTGGTRNGKIVLVEMYDQQDPESGSRFTVKEYRSSKISTEEGWTHKTMSLIPRSNNPHFETIELTQGESEFKILGVFEKIL